MRLLEIIEKHPGISYEKCVGLAARLLRVSHRALREYLNELLAEELIENRDGKLYASGYEGKNEEAKTE